MEKKKNKFETLKTTTEQKYNTVKIRSFVHYRHCGFFVMFFYLKFTFRIAFFGYVNI